MQIILKSFINTIGKHFPFSDGIVSVMHKYGPAVPLSKLSKTQEENEHLMNIVLHVIYSVGQKTSARLREQATVLGASSRNLADVFLANAVQ